MCLSLTKKQIVEACTKGSRRPPLAPARFVAELEAKSFTNGKADRPLVGRLYEEGFAAQFGRAKMLSYGGLEWGDAEAEVLAEAMATGALKSVKELYLGGNQVGDEGVRALAAAIEKGALPACKMLLKMFRAVGCSCTGGASCRPGIVCRLLPQPER